MCFARSADDGSEQRAYLQATCEEWVDVSSASWTDVVAAVAAAGVEVLVINGHCGRPQMEAFRRGAPLTITYMGHPGRAGLPSSTTRSPTA